MTGDCIVGSGKGSVFLSLNASQFEIIDGELCIISSILNPFPVGSFYIQAPVAESNDELTAFPLVNRPASLFGGTWSAEFEGEEGVFFRTKGTLSDLAGSRVDGKQADQFQGHHHTFLISNGGGGIGAQITNTSALDYGQTDRGAKVTLPTTDGVNGTPRTGSETRSINRQIKVWRRIA